MSNKSNKHIIVTLFSTAICLLAASNNVCAQVPCGGYEVTAIVSMEKCPPFGVPPVVPLGINGQGWMVGYFNPCVIGANRAWLWTPDDGLVVIPTSAGTSYSRAVAITGSLIVGEYDNSALELGRTGFLYDFETDEFTSLGTLPGGDSSKARSINGKAEIVGFWGNIVIGPSPQAFIWRNGEMIDINSDFGTAKSDAHDINSNGIVTGWMGSSITTDAHAFIWDNGKVTDLGLAPYSFTNWANTINELAQVLVRADFTDDEPSNRINGSFVFADGIFIDIGRLPGYDVIAGFDMNNEMTIVGLARAVESSNEPDVGFIWQNGVMTNLNDLIRPELLLHIQRAEAINESGQITARTLNSDNDTVAVLLTPIKGSLGDLDGDCHVSTADLLLLFASWGSCIDCRDCPADLDGNCVVSTTDLLILFSNWG